MRKTGPMRILHTNAAYAPFIGGVETYIQAMSERLAREGHSVTVATTDATRVECFWDPRQPRVQGREADLNGVHVVRCRLEHLPASPWSFYVLHRMAADLAQLPFDTCRLLTRLAARLPWIPTLERSLEDLSDSFDLVHGFCVSLEWPIIAAWRYARSHHIPFVATPLIHVGDPAVQRFHTMPHQMAVVRDADRVFVQTGLEADALVRLGVARERLVSLGMGVDLDRLAAGNGGRFRIQNGIDGSIVTFLGAVTDDKGATHLLRAMQRLWHAGSEATLVVAGQAVNPSTFERACRDLPHADRVRVKRLGPVTDQVKQDMLVATDIFCMPSRVDSFGIAYLEAWACGKPVVGCVAGGVPEVIDDGQDGLLVRFGDQASLAEALASLLADPIRCRAMGMRGRAKVEARYTWDRVYGRLREVYEEVARHASPTRSG